MLMTAGGPITPNELNSRQERVAGHPVDLTRQVLSDMSDVRVIRGEGWDGCLLGITVLTREGPLLLHHPGCVYTYEGSIDCKTTNNAMQPTKTRIRLDQVI